MDFNKSTLAKSVTRVVRLNIVGTVRAESEAGVQLNSRLQPSESSLSRRLQGSSRTSEAHG
jgi:hypothetical protein